MSTIVNRRANAINTKLHDQLWPEPIKDIFEFAGHIWLEFEASCVQIPNSYHFTEDVMVGDVATAYRSYTGEFVFHLA